MLTYHGYRCFFYSHEGYNEAREPPHIHIRKGDGEAKFWLSPVALDGSVGFSPTAVRTMTRLVTKHRDTFLEAWHERFGTT